MDIQETIIKYLIKSQIKTSDGLSLAKRQMAKKLKSDCPSNISLLKTYHELRGKGKIKKQPILEALFITRPVRSLSGIINISVLTKPYPCPGKCIYCPQEKGIPKSYLSGEPAVERAKRLKFNPYLQVKKRIEMLEAEGHPTDKIELRIVGGTWSYYPKNYQTQFIKKCFDAGNGRSSDSLESAQKANEKAKNRIIGLSIETRPDFIDEKEIERLRYLGVTMVELGVQSIYDDVLKQNKRGHNIEATIRATKLLKDAGFKVLYQMMPNLLGSSLKRDEEMFRELFKNPDFQPDLLKIYPCALLKEAPLYKLWKKKKYIPYDKKQLLILIKDIKRKIPPYVRIQRITRDIPSKRIAGGEKEISNLRQNLQEDQIRNNWKCNCIRCREVGKDYDPKEKLCLFRRDYKASDGKEIFLSFEGKEKLYSLLRLRITSDNKATIRELHTYGQLHSINLARNQKTAQHKGLGKKLMEEAEKIACAELGRSAKKELYVISGIGARDYYRKLGYKLKNTYMVKDL